MPRHRLLIGRWLHREKAWVIVRRFDYSAHGGCVPPTKTFSDWWPCLERDEYISVRGNYVSTRRSDPQLTLLAESPNSGLRCRMTIRELQLHFGRHRDARDNNVEVGNCLNATEIRIIPNSPLSRTYRRPIQMREEDMTRFVDTKSRWGNDHVMMAEKGAWVVSAPESDTAFADIHRAGIKIHTAPVLTFA